MLSLELLILFALTVLNGFFAMSEMAIVSSRRPRLEAMAGKLRRLIADFRWDRLDRIVEQEKARLA